MPLINTADAVYVGNAPADRVYLGDTLVWEAEPAGPGEGPEAIPGLLASFRADDLTLSDLAAVASWAPAAGSEGASLGQATTGQRPVYRTNQVGGQPAVVFTAASSQNLDTGAWSASHAVPLTTFVVGKRNSGNTGNFYSGRAGVFTFLGSGTSGGISFGAGGTSDGFITITHNAWHIYGLVFNGASSAYYYDSATGIAATTGTSGVAAQPGVRMSASSAGTSGYLDGAVAEMIFYNRALDTTEAGEVMEWLADKYGITLT